MGGRISDSTWTSDRHSSLNQGVRLRLPVDKHTDLRSHRFSGTRGAEVAQKTKQSQEMGWTSSAKRNRTRFDTASAPSHHPAQVSCASVSCISMSRLLAISLAGLKYLSELNDCFLTPVQCGLLRRHKEILTPNQTYILLKTRVNLGEFDRSRCGVFAASSREKGFLQLYPKTLLRKVAVLICRRQDTSKLRPTNAIVLLGCSQV